jgi:hypothetical protein
MLPQKRVVKLDIHVLAYLGDYLNAFKAVVKKKAEEILREPSTVNIPLPQVQSQAGQS